MRAYYRLEVVNQGTISRHFGPVTNKKQLRELEYQVIIFALIANISFKAVADCELVKSLRLCNPSAKVPVRTALSTTVLNLLSTTENQSVANRYEKGAFLSLCVDGWLALGGQKWILF